MSEHTPGPWVVVTSGKTLVGRDHNWRIEGLNGERVIDCSYVAYEGGGLPPQNPADLALILAAPEQQTKIDALLAACKVALDDIFRFKDAAIFGETMDMLETAIALAEGKE